MQQRLVLTILGPDRPGLVQELASLVTAHEGNWLESRMCRLGGEFAGILRCQVPERRRPAFERALAELEKAGLSVVTKLDPGESPAPGQPAVLELVGQDRPGIIRHVSSVLAAHGANVEELQSECVSAPMSGEPLFRARIRVWLPEGCDWERLRTDLERLAADLLTEVTWVPENTAVDEPD